MKVTMNEKEQQKLRNYIEKMKILRSKQQEELDDIIQKSPIKC